MMLFTIVEPFSPADGEKWISYCEWRGVRLERFDSIDGMLRPNLFTTPDEEDWEHVVNENFMLHLITDLPHATRKREQIGRGDLVGLRFEDHDTSDEGFLGFDLVDGYCDVSLLTNWGNDVEIINRSLAANALVRDWATAERIHRELKEKHGDDRHVKGSRIVSIYAPLAAPERTPAQCRPGEAPLDPSTRPRRSVSEILVQLCAAATVSVFSLCWYGIGLIGPLTPSFGTPSALELLIFVGVPIVLLAAFGVLIRSVPLRLFLAAEAAGILAFSSWLLWIQT